MPGEWVVVGQISGLFGVRGWVKVFSYTEPRAGIIGYDPLYLGRADGWRQTRVSAGRAQGKGVVLCFDGYSDRDQASKLIGLQIAVRRQQLEKLEPGQFYWADLENLSVVTIHGRRLGRVERIFDTGANDVIVVKGERERLIPFIRDQVIKSVDLTEGVIEVDWDPDF